MRDRTRMFLLPALLVVVGTAATTEAADEPKATDFPSVFDVVPASAVGAVAIRDVPGILREGAEIGGIFKSLPPTAVALGRDWLKREVGIRQGVDERGTFALAYLKSGEPESAVLALPVADAETMAANFELTAAQLVAGAVKRAPKSVKRDPLFVTLRGKHLLMGRDAELLGKAAKAEPLSTVTRKADHDTLAEDNFFLYANVRLAGPSEKKNVKSIMGLVNFVYEEELSRAMLGIGFTDGIGVSAVVECDGPKSKEFLTGLVKGKAPTSLSGLPPGKVVAAQTSNGDRQQTANFAKLGFAALLDDTKRGGLPEKLVSHRNLSNVLAVFGEGIGRLNGMRSAVYENDDPRHGFYSVVAILDTDDSQQFVADMTGLARFVNASTLPPEEVRKQIDEKSIRKLIAELGHPEYEVRELATTKLKLLGTAGLSALDEAAESGDFEVRRRAARVAKRIRTAETVAREKVENEDLLARVKPQLVHLPKQETRAETPVDFVRIRLSDEDEQVARQLRTLFGDSWDTIRLAAVGDQVVLLVGSDTTHLDKTLANLRSNEAAAGLEKQLVAFRDRAGTATNAEFHAAIARLGRLVAPEQANAPATDQPPPVTSLGLSITPQHVRLDLYSPIPDVQFLNRQAGW